MRFDQMQFAHDILRGCIGRGWILAGRLLCLYTDIDEIDLRGGDAGKIARNEIERLHRRSPAIDPVTPNGLAGERESL